MKDRSKEEELETNKMKKEIEDLKLKLNQKEEVLYLKDK